MRKKNIISIIDFSVWLGICVFPLICYVVGLRTDPTILFEDFMINNFSVSFTLIEQPLYDFLSTLGINQLNYYVLWIVTVQMIHFVVDVVTFFIRFFHAMLTRALHKLEVE